MPFDTLPSHASLTPQPFRAHVSDEELEAFKTLLRYSRLGPKTYENQVADVKDFNSFGITHKWLEDAKKHWETQYDWRKSEDRINALPNYTAQIEHNGDKYSVHFAALFSKKSDAVPLMLLHGWPGSFLEFLGTLEVLKKKYDEDSLPFHVVVPSLTGYGYSSGPPLDKDFKTEDVSSIVDKLMRGLGFESGYIAQGGDVGSFMARILGVTSDACKSVHLNLAIGVTPTEEDMKTMKQDDKLALGRARDFSTLGNAYAREHGTRPATIGLVLSSSPLGLLAWIGEKFQQWSDTTPSLNDMLDGATLYWFTNSFPRAIYPYRQLFGAKPQLFHNDPEFHLKKPFGYSWHPKELAPTPTSLVAQTGNLVWHREHSEGGHFIAWEKPDLFVQDLEEFVKEVWPQVKGS